MNCEFNYKGDKFNIKAELYSMVERRMGGKTLHSITIRDISNGNSNWHKKIDTEPSSLLEAINILKSEAINYVEGVNNKTSEEQLLLDLGFE